MKAQEQLKKKRPIPELNSLPMAAVPEPIVLDAPRDTPFTVAELAKFDGAVAGEPIYVAMKGIIFDGTSLVALICSLYSRHDLYDSLSETRDVRSRCWLQRTILISLSPLYDRR